MELENIRVPTWQELCQETLNPQDMEEEDEESSDEWRPGWQYYMSSHMNVVFVKSFRESLPDNERAILRSGSGPHAAP